MNFLIFAVLSAFQAVSKASNPYYYVPPQVQYQFPSVPTFNSFGNPFTTSTYFVNPHFQYRTSPQIHTPIHQIHTTIPQINTHIPQIPNVQTNHKQNYENVASDYQGFAYHTRNDQGATSHVLFVSGPQSQSVRSALFPTFNQVNINTPNFGNNEQENVDKAKSYASNMVDSINKENMDSKATENEYPKNIQEINNTPTSVEQIHNDPGQFFRSFFQRSEPSVVNFYSRNSNLFVRPAPGYPSNTFPLTNTNARYNSPFISPRFNPITSTEKPIETTTETAKKSENVAQESVITNTRFRVNDLIENFEKFTATTTSSMSPIVVEETTVASSSMKPIVVQEVATTETFISSTEAQDTTTTKTTTPTVLVTTELVTKTSTEQAKETTTDQVTELTTLKTITETESTLIKETESSVIKETESSVIKETESSVIKETESSVIKGTEPSRTTEQTSTSTSTSTDEIEFMQSLISFITKDSTSSEKETLSTTEENVATTDSNVEESNSTTDSITMDTTTIESN